MDPRPREGVPQSPETKPLRPDVSTQPPDFRVFQLPKSGIITFDGSPLNYRQFMKTIANSVETFPEDGDIRLQLLIKHCTGKAREAIKSCGMLNGIQGYEKAKELLKKQVGEKYVVPKASIDKLSYGPPIRLNDSEALNDLADDLENCEITLKVSGRLDQVNNEDRMVQILERVPPYLRARWLKTVQEIRVCGRDPTFADLKKRIRTASKEKNDPVFGSILDPVFKQDRSRVKPRTRFSSTHAVHAGSTDPKYRVDNGRGFTLNPSIKCFLCNGSQKLETCGQFSAKSSEEKLKFVCDSCAKTVSLTLILQVVAGAHEAVLLSSAPLPVSICNPYTTPWLLVFEVETAKETIKEFLDLVLINSLPSYTRNKVITL